MRKLLAKDIAPFTKILAKMELKDSIKTMFSGNKDERGAMISELIWGVVENFPKAENELFNFLADLEGKTFTEISELPLNDFIELIKTLFGEENIPFFKSAAK
jgi:hypothetical protein